MLAFLITLVKLLVILCIVATIHEFGHFLAAKLFKVGVNEFSIGFGPKIIQKKYKGTMYSLRWLPLGGYCAIDGEGEESTNPNSFGNINLFKKIVILCRGVIFNAILAIAIFLSIAFAFPTYTTKIAEFMPNSVLEQAGVNVGDTIYSINGKRTTLQSQLLDTKYDYVGPDVQVEYIRDGQKYETTVKNAVRKIGYIGVSFRLNEGEKEISNVIDMVSSGGAAMNIGLKAGDRITHIDGVETPNSKSVVNTIRDSSGKEVELTVKRGEEVFTKKVTPDTKNYFDLNIAATEKVNTTLPLAIDNMILNVQTIVGSYVDLFTGKVGIKDMSGIVGIGEVVSKTNGILEFLNLMGVISLAIGVANIMPFPPLDGGKIVISIGEAITRKKLSLKAEAIISYIGFGLLFLLTIFVTYNDIIRIF